MPALQTPPLSLYVHLPWCVQKCPYCDFNSHPLRGMLQENAYLAALLRDLDEELNRIAEREIGTVFFGGGTPSLFSPDAIARVLQRLHPHLAAQAEVTLEANPGTVEHGRFRGYRDAGVNRLSLGAQSFDDGALKRLGRIHGAAEISDAVDEACAGGFDNFNLDLMYGLPDQSLDGALADVTRALALKPSHISHYQLTLEPQTLFAKHPPPLPPDDLIWLMQLRCQEKLSDAGFEQYETSAYARDGRRCQHNLNYWQYGDYIAIGAGAHGKLTRPETDLIERREKPRQPGHYMRDSSHHTHLVGKPDRVFEFMLNALRLNAGFDREQFEARTGCPLAGVEPTLESAQQRGLLQYASGHYYPTPLGKRFLNDLQMLFLPEQGQVA